MTHILVISQVFFPENFRVNDIATEWVKRGYKVTVVTGIPNYPKGEYYEGYSKKERTRENWNGIDIIRLPIRPRKTGMLNLGLNYLSFVRQGKKWVRKAKDIKADVVFTYEVSPMTQALVGVKYSKKYRIPHILYVTDLWPENVEIITGVHNRLFIGSIQKMVDYIYRRSDKILTSSKSFIEKIQKRGIPESRIEFWPQYAEDFYKPVEGTNDQSIPHDEILNLVFAGNIGYAQGLSILPKAAVELKKRKTQVRFIIIGDGRYKSELLKIVDESDVGEYFRFIDRKPAEDIPAYLCAGDASLITLSKSEVFAITIPAKTQSCLACGKPILLSADGEVRNIIDEAKAGLTSASEDVEGFVENIIKFVELSPEERKKMGDNALEYSKKHFVKEDLLNRFDKIIKD